MKTLVFIAIVLLSSQPAQSQATFEKIYGGTAPEEGHAIVALEDGYALCGTLFNAENGSYDIWFLRTNPDGDTLYSRTIGTPGFELGVSMEATADGGFIICGSAADEAGGPSGFYLVKLDASGDTAWTRRNFNNTEATGSSVAIAEGGYILCGYSSVDGVISMTLIRTDQEGIPLWTKTYGDTLSTSGSMAIPANGGGFIACGAIDNTDPAWNRNMYVVRTDDNGDTLWTRQYGGLDYEMAWSVAPGTETGYLITGYTQGYLNPGGDIVAVRINEMGETQWLKTYGRSGLDIGYSGKACIDGGYVITGSSALEGSELQQVILLRTDEAGDTLWTALYGGYPKSAGLDVDPLTSGGYAVAGSTNSIPGNDYDFYFLKTDNDGNILALPGEESAEKAFVLFPNPSTGQVTISFPAGSCTYEIVTLQGVLVMKGQRTPADPRQAVVDLSLLPPGMYIATLGTESGASVSRIVLL